MDASEWMTVAEAARACGISVSSIRRQITSGAIPAVRWGRVYRVRGADVAAAIAAAQVQTTTTDLTHRNGFVG